LTHLYLCIIIQDMGRVEAAENNDIKISGLRERLYRCQTGLNKKEPHRLVVKLLEELDCLELQQNYQVVEYDGTPLPEREAEELALVQSIRTLASACPRLGKHRSHRDPLKR